MGVRVQSLERACGRPRPVRMVRQAVWEGLSRRPPGEQPHEKAARDLGFEATWPPTFKHIGIEGLTEDTDREDIENFLSLVEWVGDHVARPRRIERTHLWDSCGRHYARFSIETGKLVYYSRVNSLLSQQRIPFVLADAGADAGYVVERVDDARTDLLTRAVETAPADSQSEVEAAISQFRRHGADRSDKHAAVLSLFRVLENLRTDVKDHLLSQDERDLFNIANNFDIRHKNKSQKSDYRTEMLDWIFWVSLASIELVHKLRVQP